MILLTGHAGYVGGIILRHLERRNDLCRVDCRSLGNSGEYRFQCDLTNPDAVRRLADQVHPKTIIHAAGNKDIRFCERNPEEAFRINAETVNNVVVAFPETRVIYISTDYVFDGSRGPYRETDAADPKTIYGKSKLAGESCGLERGRGRFLILRSSAIFDLAATFPGFLMDQLSRGMPIECFTDAIYSPTYYKDFLVVLDRLLEGRGSPQHVYHACGEPMTRYGFAINFARVFGFDEGLIRPTSGKMSDLFLFPNLSLDNSGTEGLLGVHKTPLREALEELRKISGDGR